jgi:hypothetical protein
MRPRILIVADGRSPIALRWLQALGESGYSVSLVSTYYCPEPEGLAYFHVLPAAFGQFASSTAAAGGPSGQATPALRRLIRRFRGAFMAGRYALAPLSLARSAQPFRWEVEKAKPDLVHALRIPYEGMLARYTPASIPLAISIWGNDLTLHAHGSAAMGRLTGQTLARTQGLMADAQRDLRLARLWGLPENTPTLAVPGSGGLDMAELQRPGMPVDDLLGLDLPPDRPLVLNPRGLRPGSLRSDSFFQAIPDILKSYPDAVFVCAAMAGQPEALGWVEKLGLQRCVILLPSLPQARLWDLFRRANVFVSPGAHDGTPNSLLEGMACGCFPIAGDIESLREWIVPGVNGLLIDPADPPGLAEAVRLALAHPELRKSADEYNRSMLAARASRQVVMQQVETFYEQILVRTAAGGKNE